MPNPHYQRVLEQDRSLPAPLRWLSRGMSSWWLIGLLSVVVVGYVFFAHAPLGETYLWQWAIFDTTQHAMLTWWPLLIAAWLLASAVAWSAMRRLPWRIDNLGAFVAVLGLVMVLVSQSWAFRSQSVGIAAVPITPYTGEAQTDALSLSYTTRFGDTHQRVLVVMVRGNAPLTIPIDGIPRWNDAVGDRMPDIKLHDDNRLASAIGFGTRIVTAAYIADGTLTETDDGTQTPNPTPNEQRRFKQLPYPSSALLALDITTDLEDGGTKTTTAWLPFEPDGTDSLVPDRFFPVEGLGSVGLAFRPASKKLPFALAANMPDQRQKQWAATVHLADADTDGRLTEPASYELRGQRAFDYVAPDVEGVTRQFDFVWLSEQIDRVGELGSEPLTIGRDSYALIEVKTFEMRIFILAGMITFVLGVALDRILDWFAGRPRKLKSASKPLPADKT